MPPVDGSCSDHGLRRCAPHAGGQVDGRRCRAAAALRKHCSGAHRHVRCCTSSHVRTPLHRISPQALLSPDTWKADATTASGAAGQDSPAFNPAAAGFDQARRSCMPPMLHASACTASARMHGAWLLLTHCAVLRAQVAWRVSRSAALRRWRALQKRAAALEAAPQGSGAAAREVRACWHAAYYNSCMPARQTAMQAVPAKHRMRGHQSSMHSGKCACCFRHRAANSPPRPPTHPLGRVCSTAGQG